MAPGGVEFEGPGQGQGKPHTNPYVITATWLFDAVRWPTRLCSPGSVLSAQDAYISGAGITKLQERGKGGITHVCTIVG